MIEEIRNHFDVVASTPFDNCVSDLEQICNRLIQTEFDRRGINPIKDLRLLMTYARIVREERPDLVISYTIKPNIYGGIVSRFRGVPYAVNITGLGSVFEKRGLLQKLVILLYKISLKKARVIFFENSGDRDVFLRETNFPTNKTFVLHGAGVNTSTFYYQQYPNNEFTKFLFIGRVMKEKGIEELLEAGHRLVSEGYKCTLDVVGPCEENYKDILNMYENEGWLTYHGFQTDVRAYIGACDCFVLPSYHEGMANTNLECASSGRVIITSNIPGCKEACINGVSGYLCQAKDSEDLYAKMKKIILSEKEELVKMGIEGRKHMLAQFKKELIVKQTINALEIL